MNTFIFSKNPQTDVLALCDFTSMLQSGETITAITIQTIQPTTTPPLVATLQSAPTNPQALILLSGGLLNASYGFPVLITTNARQLVAQVAATVLENDLIPFTTQNPEAYVDLVDSIEAGKSAVSTAVFSFPATLNPQGGYVVWEMLDNQGTVYASGNAYDYIIQSNGISNTVLAHAVINCPSSVPPSDIDCKYQLRYTLSFADAIDNQQSSYFSYENITVIGLTTVPTGTQDQIELRGITATVSIVIDKLYDTVVVNLYKDNDLMGSSPVTQSERVSSGYYFAASFDTSAMEASLEPYHIVWQYSNSAEPALVYSESAKLWISNPTVMDAVSDVRAKINKARTTLYGQPDMLFPAETVMLWLRRARDAFNGYAGVFTSFTMLNAKGAIREYWLLFAEKAALDSQYLAEGEKAFNFSGAAISLDVDRTGFLDSMSSKIQGILDNEFKPFKQILVTRGNTGGDGSVDPTKLAHGAIGAVGITITPASPWGPFRGGFPYPTTFRKG